jgi:hypothetical protein
MASPHCLREGSREREHEADRQLGHGIRIRGRRVRDYYSPPGSRCKVDIARAYAITGHHAKARRGREDRRINLVQTSDEAIDIGDFRAQLICMKWSSTCVEANLANGAFQFRAQTRIRRTKRTWRHQDYAC